MNIELDISIEDNRWNIEIDFLEKVVNYALKVTKQQNAEIFYISFLFTCDSKMRELNREFRKIDKPTNVLSFPGQPYQLNSNIREIRILGDIALGYETIEKEANEQKKTFGAHLTHMIVHGMLHLLGYDHKNEEEERIMIELEDRIIDEI